VDAIRSGEILEAEDVSTTRIEEDSTSGEAKQKMEAVDENPLAVVDQNDWFMGVLTYGEVTSKLLARLTRELEQ